MTSETEYFWKFKTDESRNFGIHEITRINGDRREPFTVIIYNYSDVGDKQLFPDLFYSDDWDEGRSASVISSDVKFCIHLWKYLGLEEKYGVFHPRHIEHDLDRSPIVYRNTMENVMNRKFGCGHSRFENAVKETPVANDTATIKLDLTVGESDESIYEKIATGMISARDHHSQNRSRTVSDDVVDALTNV